MVLLGLSSGRRLATLMYLRVSQGGRERSINPKRTWIFSVLIE